MDRYKLAELMLRSVVPREHAEGIVGDVVELSREGKGTFWCHITRVIVAFLWWPAVAFFLCLPVGFLACIPVEVHAAQHFWFGHIKQPSLLVEAARYQAFIGPLGTLAAFTLLRYGLREKTWVLSAITATLVTGMAVSLWMPNLRLPIAVGALLIFLWSASRREWRPSAVAMVFAVLLGVVLQYGAQEIVGLSTLHHVHLRWLNLWLLPLLITTPFTPLSYAMLRREWMSNRVGKIA